MRISAILENAKNLTVVELASTIKTFERALIEHKAAAALMTATQKQMYARPRTRTLEQAIAALQRELKSRQQSQLD